MKTNQQKTIAQLLSERESKMYHYYRSVFEDGFEGGYPAEYDEPITTLYNRGVEAGDVKVKNAFQETRAMQQDDEIHCGCLDYCEWIIEGKPDDAARKPNPDDHD